MTQPTGAGPYLGAIKKKQQATWASADFAVVGTTLQIVGEMLAEAVDIRSGELPGGRRGAAPLSRRELRRRALHLRGALDANGQKGLADGIVALVERMHVGGAGPMVVPGEYLEVVITRKGQPPEHG